jgi:23S rRNA (uracil1939-C5)-methyltransferase/tRNA (uracil-5-)-methyltransferase
LTNRGWGIARVPLNDNDDDEMTDSETATSNDDNSSSSSNNNKNKPWVVMVPGVIAGEDVRIRIFRNFHNYSEADLIEVVKASPDRRTPPCPLANDHCGGCQLQHMTLERQRLWKTEMVQEFLASYTVLNNVVVRPTLGTDEELGYRSKLTPHYQQPQKSRHGTRNVDLALSVVDSHTNTTKKIIHAIGFQRKTSRQLVDVEHCPIATPAVNHAYAAVRANLLADPPQRNKGATLLFRQANLGDDYVETNHKKVL